MFLAQRTEPQRTEPQRNEPQRNESRRDESARRRIDCAKATDLQTIQFAAFDAIAWNLTRGTPRVGCVTDLRAKGLG